MENIISTNISAPAPWYYLTQTILSIIIGVSIVSIIVLLLLIVINKIKNGKINKIMIISLVICFIMLFITGMTPVMEDILIAIFKVIYGY